ncbi:MAG: hypothetical protein ACRENW_08265, partial [Thermodesulfobacteriota bacterium]
SQVGADGKATNGHDEPPWGMPGVRSSGQQEVRINRVVQQRNQVDSVLPADGRRPERLGSGYRPMGREVKHLPVARERRAARSSTARSMAP